MNEKTRSILIKVGRGCHWIAQGLFATLIILAVLAMAASIFK